MGGILSGSMVLRDEQPVKFAVGAVAQLLGDCRGLALNPQELVFRAKLHDLIRVSRSRPVRLLPMLGGSPGL